MHILVLGKVNIGGKVQYCPLKASVLLRIDLMNAVFLLIIRLNLSQCMRSKRMHLPDEAFL
ncbi:hypothetical protein AL013_06450 [Mariprofundus ferrooxydans]|nr:hypothetical protein AL013_06450 [Mariprofundus ferrooxydans]